MNQKSAFTDRAFEVVPMSMRSLLPVFLVLLLPQLVSCDLIEPTDRPYNNAAHPPGTGELAAMGVAPGEALTGNVLFFVDTFYATILVDGQSVFGGGPGSMPYTPRMVGFDTRAYPEGVHTLAVGLKRSPSGPNETGILGYIGIPDITYSGEVQFRQTVPFELPVQPFVPWDNDFRERPAVDGVRSLLYVLEKDSVKAFSTSANTLLRSRGLTHTEYSGTDALRHFALSADGTRLYVYAITQFGIHYASIIVLDALTFDSLAAYPVQSEVYGLACGDREHLYVSSLSTDVYIERPPVLRVLSTSSMQQTTAVTLPGTRPAMMVVADDRKTVFLAGDGVSRVFVEGGTPSLQAHSPGRRYTSIGVSPDVQRLFLVGDTERITIANPVTLDSTGCIEPGYETENVWDLLPAGNDLFAVLSVWTGSSTGRVVKYSSLLAMSASWDFGMYVYPYPLQISGDGRFLYAGGGARCIPIP